eukprot:4835367-Alexandrium_andersonii.AAC.1
MWPRRPVVWGPCPFLCLEQFSVVGRSTVPVAPPRGLPPSRTPPEWRLPARAASPGQLPPPGPAKKWFRRAG